VEFAVLKRHDREGEHCTYRATGDHYIGVSAYKIGTTKALMEVMGHEMIHARQEATKTAGPGEHNAKFHVLAGRACRYHGWDRKLFV